MKKKSHYSEWACEVEWHSNVEGWIMVWQRYLQCRWSEQDCKCLWASTAQCAACARVMWTICHRLLIATLLSSFSVKLLTWRCSRARLNGPWFGLAEWKKKNNRRENVWKKNDECFSPNEQDTKLGCSVAMATPARQLAFFVGGCAIIFDEQSGAHNCK